MIALITAVVAISVTMATFHLQLKTQKPAWWVQQTKARAPWRCGGFAPFVGICFGVCIGMILLGSGDTFDNYARVKLVTACAMALGFGLLGLLDDYLMVVKRREIGFGNGQKLLLEVGVTALYLGILHLSGVLSTFLAMPFFGTVDFGAFSYLLLALAILLTVNAVERTQACAGVCYATSFLGAIGGCLAAALLDAQYGSVLFSALAAVCVATLFFYLRDGIDLGRSGRLLLTSLLVGGFFCIGLPMYVFVLLLVYWVEGVYYLIQYLARELGGKDVTMQSFTLRCKQIGKTNVQLLALSAIITTAGVVALLFAVWLIQY